MPRIRTPINLHIAHKKGAYFIDLKENATKICKHARNFTPKDQ